MAGAVIDDVLVNLVGDRKGVPAHAKFANKFQFLASENLTGRIVRSIHDDGLGARTKGARKFLAIEFPIRRMQAHKAGLGAGKNSVRAVVFVERLEDDHFVARIDDGHQGGDHGFGGTAANGDLAFRIDGHALRARELLDDRIAQGLRSPGDGVLIVVGGDGSAGRLLDFRRARENPEILAPD